MFAGVATDICLCFQKWTRTSIYGSTDVCVHAYSKIEHQGLYGFVIWTAQSACESPNPHFKYYKV